MSGAPERIWLIETDTYNPYRVSCSTAPHSPDESTEYVRADRIEVLEREVKELRAEAKGHKRLKNELVLKAYPAMDAIDEIAEGFRSAVHFVRNNAMNMERDYPEICHAEEVFSRARAALSGPNSGWLVPDGWKLVPVELTNEMKERVRSKGGPQALAFAIAAWPDLLSAAPQQGRK